MTSTAIYMLRSYLDMLATSKLLASTNREGTDFSMFVVNEAYFTLFCPHCEVFKPHK